MIKGALCVFLAIGMLAFNDDEKKDDKVNLKGVKCVVMGKNAAKDSKYVETKDGTKLYMCCGNCVKAYNKNPEKYATKANHQRVATGQFVQTSCPFSGGKMNEEAKVKVGGVELKMCCGNCVKKINGAESEDAKAEMVFNAKTFKKGFAKKKTEKEDKG